MSNWLNWTYDDKHLFFLLAIPLALYVLWVIFDNKGPVKSLTISSFKNFLRPSSAASWRFLVPLFRAIAIGFIVLGLARPQDGQDESYQQFSSEGIDIVIAFDVSSSMLAMDFEPNRLEVARDLAIDFIDKRKNDRLGLVVFEGEAFTLCPLTTDRNVIKSQFKLAEPGQMAQGTAIGMGLATAINRLRESEAKSKVVVLLTDGVNNQGNVDPSTAADIAHEFGIRVYTIGVGKKGKAKYPVQDYFGNLTYQYMPVEIDEPLLQEIAQKTGGEYFRAVNEESLKGIYEKIDQLEKSKINVVEFRRDPPEKFHAFAFLGICFLLAELLLRKTVFNSPFW